MAHSGSEPHSIGPYLAARAEQALIMPSAYRIPMVADQVKVVGSCTLNKPLQIRRRTNADAPKSADGKMTTTRSTHS